jgi:hypothetical protein
MRKRFRLIMGISAGAFVVSVLAHNAISAWFNIEEAVFFTIAVFLCPTTFLVGAVGSIVLAVRGTKKGRPR